MNGVVNLALVVGAISLSCHPTCSTGMLSNVSLHVHNVRDRWHVADDENKIRVQKEVFLIDMVICMDTMSKYNELSM